MKIQRLLLLLLVSSVAFAALGNDASTVERYQLREIKPTALMPRAVDVYLEIEKLQPDVSLGLRTNVVVINRGSSPVSLVNLIEHSVLLLSDAEGPREYPAGAQKMVIAGRLGDSLPRTEIAPGDEVKFPLNIETVFALPPKPAPAPPVRPGPVAKGDVTTTTASAYGDRTSLTPEPIAAGTYTVRLQTMLWDSSVQFDETGRHFLSPSVKVILGGGAQ